MARVLIVSAKPARSFLVNLLCAEFTITWMQWSISRVTPCQLLVLLFRKFAGSELERIITRDVEAIDSRRLAEGCSMQLSPYLVPACQNSMPLFPRLSASRTLRVCDDCMHVGSSIQERSGPTFPVLTQNSVKYNVIVTRTLRRR